MCSPYEYMLRGDCKHFRCSLKKSNIICQVSLILNVIFTDSSILFVSCVGVEFTRKEAHGKGAGLMRIMGIGFREGIDGASEWHPIGEAGGKYWGVLGGGYILG